MLNLLDKNAVMVEMEKIETGYDATRKILTALRCSQDVVNGKISPVNEFIRIMQGFSMWPCNTLNNGSIKPYGLTTAKNACKNNEERMAVKACTCINSMVNTDKNNEKKATVSAPSVSAPSVSAPTVSAPSVIVRKKETGENVSSLIEFIKNNRISEKAIISLLMG